MNKQIFAPNIITLHVQYVIEMGNREYNKTPISPLFYYFFLHSPLKKSYATIDNVPANQDEDKTTDDLSAYPPKLRHFMCRISRWRLLYGIVGFVFGMIKCIIDIVSEFKN